MTTVNWLVDNKLFNKQDERQGLIEALYNGKFNADVFLTKHFPFNDDNETIKKAILTERPVVVYGTIGFVKRVQEVSKKLREEYNYDAPYTFGFNDTDCFDYISKYPADWFLNEKAVFVPFCRFVEQKNWWYEIFNTSELFIRPNSGFKTFTGCTIKWGDFDYEINSLKQLTGVIDSTIIMVAPARSIIAETRYIIANKKVIHSAAYRHHTIRYSDGGYVSYQSEEADALAEKVAKWPYQPDFAYVVDIAMTRDHGNTFDVFPKILEFNAFCSAGFYTTYYEDIVNNINDVAIAVKKGELMLER